MKWSEKAWQAIAPVLNDIREHPFVRELAAGTLAPEKFSRYLAQDRIYLANYAREMKDLAAMLPKGPLSELYGRFAEESMEAEASMHKDYSDYLTDKSTEALEGTVEYMRHTSEIIASGDLAMSMAAMLPCMWVYSEVGKHIAGMAAGGRDNPYHAWIECYSSPLMDEGVKSSIELTDGMAEKEDGDRQALMTMAFVKSTQFEWIFWDQAYNE